MLIAVGCYEIPQTHDKIICHVSLPFFLSSLPQGRWETHVEFFSSGNAMLYVLLLAKARLKI